MPKKKSSKKSIKKLHLDKPTSHGGWPGGHSGSYRDPNTPVNKQISKFLSDIGLLDDDNPRARLSEDKIRVKRAVLEGLLKKILQESNDEKESILNNLIAKIDESDFLNNSYREHVKKVLNSIDQVIQNNITDYSNNINLLNIYLIRILNKSYTSYLDNNIAWNSNPIKNESERAINNFLADCLSIIQLYDNSKYYDNNNEILLKNFKANIEESIEKEFAGLSQSNIYKDFLLKIKYIIELIEGHSYLISSRRSLPVETEDVNVTSQSTSNIRKKRKIRLSKKISIFEKMPGLSISVTEKKFKSLFGEEFNQSQIVDFSRFDIQTIKYLAVEKKPTTFTGTFFENVVASYMINKENISENNILNLNNIKKGFANFDFYVGDIKEFKEALITSLKEKKKEVSIPGYFIQVKSILIALQDVQFNKNLFSENVENRNELFWQDISPYLNIVFSEEEDYPTLNFKVKIYVPGLKFESGTRRGDITKVDYTGQYQRTGGAGNMFKRNLSKVFKDNPEIYDEHIKRSYNRLKNALDILTKDLDTKNIEKEYNDFFDKKEEIYAMKRIFNLDLVEEFYNYKRPEGLQAKLRVGYKEPYTFFHGLELLIKNKKLIRSASKNSSNYKAETYFIQFFSDHLSNLSENDKNVYLEKIKKNKSVILEKAMKEKAHFERDNIKDVYVKSLNKSNFYNAVVYLNYIYHRGFDELTQERKLNSTVKKIIAFLIDTYITKSINEKEAYEINDLIGKNIFEKDLNKNDIDNITKNILIYMGINEVLITDNDYQFFYSITESLIEKIKDQFNEKLELKLAIITPFLYSDYVYADNSVNFQLHSKEIDISFSNSNDEISEIESQATFEKQIFKSNDSFGTYPSIVSAMYTIKSGQARKISSLGTVEGIFTGIQQNRQQTPVLFDVSAFGGIKISEEPVYLTSSEMEIFTRNIADFYARLTTSSPFRLIINTKDDEIFSSYIEDKEEYINSKIIDIYQKLTSALDAQTYELRITGNEEIEADLENIVSIILSNANKYINKEIEQIINRIRRHRAANNYTSDFDFDETTMRFVKAVLKKEFIMLTDLFEYLSYYKEESFFSRWENEIQQFLIEAFDQNIDNTLGKRIVYSVFLLILLLNLFDYNELNSYKSKYKFLVSKSYKNFNFGGEIEPETQIEILPDPEENEQDKDEILGLTPQDNNEPDDLPNIEYDEDIIDITSLRRQQVSDKEETEEDEDERMVAESKLFKLVVKDLFKYLNR